MSSSESAPSPDSNMVSLNQVDNTPYASLHVDYNSLLPDPDNQIPNSMTQQYYGSMDYSILPIGDKLSMIDNGQSYKPDTSLNCMINAYHGNGESPSPYDYNCNMFEENQMHFPEVSDYHNWPNESSILSCISSCMDSGDNNDNCTTERVSTNF